jgi:uncharacterized protein YabN with tetrapyrrole methylase and pyrophosphatase domain
MGAGSLQVVGTGYLIAGHATPQAVAAMRRADKLLYLVGDRPTRAWIESLNPSAESLQDAYAVDKRRSQSYQEMVERILAPLRRGLDVCAAFYGHPGVLAHPSHAAIRQAREEGFDAWMLPGISAADCLYADLRVDPGAQGCQSFEATDFLLRARRFDPTSVLLLWQIGATGRGLRCSLRSYRNTTPLRTRWWSMKRRSSRSATRGSSAARSPGSPRRR